MRWLGSTKSAIPSPPKLLRLVYLGRMCLATAIYLSAALKIRVAAPLDILAASLMLVSSTGVTLASYWHTHVRRSYPGPTFLYLQAVFDVALITGVVHITGGPESDFAGLYVVVIAVTALLMRPAQAGLVTTFAGLVYFADVFWGHHTAVSLGLWIQLGVFVLVAVVTAYVASRVTVMGAEREALAAGVRAPRAGVLGGGDLHGAARRAPDARGGHGAPARPHLSHRRDDHHPRRAHRRGAACFGDLRRHLRVETPGGAPSPRRASRGGGRAVVEPGARDQEPPRVDSQLGGAAGEGVAVPPPPEV